MNPGRQTVLLVGDTLNLGGTEGQFVEIACRIDRSQWDVEVACVRPEGPLLPRIQGAGIQPWRCGPTSFKSPRLAGAIVSLARRIRARKISVVHSFDFYSNILAVTAGRLAGVPVVIASQRELGDLRSRLQQRLNRAVLGIATRVLVNSRATYDRLTKSGGLRNDRVALIPNGIDVVRFHPGPRRVDLPAGPTVGTVANLRPEKGIGDLVRAAVLVREYCPGVRFLIWGDGPLRGELEALADALGVGDIVTFRGTTETPEVALRHLDIFVLPSLSEACSNALLEAMATAIPVVVTRIGGSSMVVEEGDTGLLAAPADPAALAKAIIKLIDDPALAARCAGRGLERARGEFGLTRMVQRFETLYHEALAERRR